MFGALTFLPLYLQVVRGASPTGSGLLIVPIFFGQGGHVREDVPALVEVLRKRWTGVAVSVSRTAGDDSGVVDALATFCIHELDQPGQ